MNKPESSIPRRLMANPRVQIILFLFALIYIISPVDFIPDLPPIGWIDDGAVFIAEVFSFVFYLKEKRRNMKNGKTEKENEGTNHGS